ncbi:hypothetical protein [Aquipseudomonas alcaligenes]|uniref:hypothetical protein n=1 Tax=Aquipseudomonas alcaligenes TaxID=43263 RepID=UPI000B2725A7|nr:hypothetical protein [Pseudomonas alcaligenes]
MNYESLLGVVVQALPKPLKTAAAVLVLPPPLRTKSKQHETHTYICVLQHGARILNKDDYQIPRKSDFICLTILLHDLKCFDEELSKPIEDIATLIHKMRCTRNVFVSLHNLKESIHRIPIRDDAEFALETKSLRRDLDFIVHIRNKGVGHLDKTLLERAAQWTPELFHTESHRDNDYLTFLSYKSVLESTINSYLNEDGEQKLFRTEIDFLYPPNATQFFNFLSDIVKRSTAWLENAREIIKSELKLHSDDKLKEMGAIAAQTNFDLKSESSFEFNADEVNERLISTIDAMRAMGAKEELIAFIEKKLSQ